MRILLTRPLPQSEATAAVLRARGHEVLLAPLLQMQQTPGATGGTDYDGLLVTSANALRALTDGQIGALRALPLLAVGDRTAEAARERGFLHVQSAAGDASDLVRLAIDLFRPPARLLYLAGEHQARDLSAALAAHGIAVTTVVTYRMAPAESLPQHVGEALRRGAIDAVLHYSARTAEAYIACAAAAGLREAALAPAHCCISQEVAERLRRAGAPRVLAAERPDEPALLQLLTAF